MKNCTKCLALKPLEDYHSNRRYKDGRARACKECKKKDRKRHYEKNKAKELEQNRQYYKQNIGLLSVKKKAYLKEWAQNNKEKTKKSNKLWKSKNKELINSYTAFRRANKIKATPPWVDRVELAKIYQNCPEGYHVDHIVPLNHPLVCGLHVPWNLQYLTAEENLKKSNSCDILVVGGSNVQKSS